MAVRFAEADYQVVIQAAAALGVAPSDYVRQAALRTPSEMLADVILYLETRFDKIQSAPRPETK
jgi:hypothetical protein